MIKRLPLMNGIHFRFKYLIVEIVKFLIGDRISDQTRNISQRGRKC